MILKVADGCNALPLIRIIAFRILAAELVGFVGEAANEILTHGFQSLRASASLSYDKIN